MFLSNEIFIEVLTLFLEMRVFNSKKSSHFNKFNLISHLLILSMSKKS